MVAQAVAAIALGLLGASGVVKLIDPGPTTGAMSTAGLPSSDTLSRFLGVVEVVVAAMALAAGGLALIAAAGLYFSFAVFTASFHRRLPLQSCGCFGHDETPPTATHLGYNVVAMVALLTVALRGSAPIDWGLPQAELVTYLGFAVIGAYASYLLLARLPRLMSVARHS
ncbi:MAG TPA: MauE/DoxX family redox-associated membrane protein [Acidimicrobiia bacterium]|nr:MauE/DoxX family redox-associated membrane protein [Acidimicrobiia bacterium]